MHTFYPCTFVLRLNKHFVSHLHHSRFYTARHTEARSGSLEDIIYWQTERFCDRSFGSFKFICWQQTLQDYDNEKTYAYFQQDSVTAHTIDKSVCLYIVFSHICQILTCVTVTCEDKKYSNLPNTQNVTSILTSRTSTRRCNKCLQAKGNYFRCLAKYINIECNTCNYTAWS